MKNRLEELQTSLFLRGEGFFSTILQTASGYAFLNRHLSRLKKTCTYFGFTEAWSDLEPRLLKELFSINLKDEAEQRVRISFFKVNNQLRYHIDRSVYQRPQSFSLYTSNKRRCERMMPTFFKDHFYLPYTLEKQQRKLKENSDLLILNNESIACETSMGNIFFRFGDKLMTPKNEKSFYSGITREVLIELFSDSKIELECKDLSFEEFKNADEVWITSSLKRVMRINNLDEIHFDDGSSILPKVLAKFIEKERRESRDT